MSKKKSTDVFADEDRAARPMNEFEALLNATGVSARGLSVGDRFRGEVLAVSAQEAFISTGSPSDAILPLVAGREAPKVGDVLDVVVVRARENEILVKVSGSTGGGGEVDSLEDAFDMELPVEGQVLEAVKGGFRVKVAGQSAFCPISQIDWRCTDPSAYVGRKYEFIITKWERGRDLVVSRRKVLELQRAEHEGEFLNTAQVGDILSGQIVRLEKYGAFVRLENGIEGLVPISEMSWGRIAHPADVVSMDQSVQVKLIRMEEDGDRLKLSFSIKQGGSTADPWETIEQEFPVGRNIEGTIEHKEPFGLFVNIALGVTGLLPRSAWRDAVDGNQYENKRRGDRVKVRVDRVDTNARKLSFSLPREDEDESWREHSSASARPSGGGLGTLADLLKNVKVKN